MSESNKAREAQRLARLTGVPATDPTIRKMVGDNSTLKDRVAASRAKQETGRTIEELSAEQIKDKVYSILAAHNVDGAEIGQFVHEALGEDSMMSALQAELSDQTSQLTQEQRITKWLAKFFPSLG